MENTRTLRYVEDGSVVWYDNKLWTVAHRPAESSTTDLWRPEGWREVPAHTTEVVVVAYGFRLGQEWLEQQGTKPVHTHECPSCTYLGTVRCRETEWTYGARYDLYFCTQGGTIPTVLARWSSNGPDYTSGLRIATKHIKDGRAWHPLATAYLRAVQYGLVDEKEAPI